MKMVKKWITFLFFSIIIFSLQAQSFDSVCSPMNIPLTITGNYGDIRSASFHFGLDYSTLQKTGFPVFSIAEGFLSRVKVEPGGYGKAIYIEHTNGFTTVYAHLDSFNQTIEDTVKAIQYRQKSFAVDIQFNDPKIKIKKADIIGYSGNSGLSSGPHLHFEIRETLTQNTINSLFLNFNKQDNYKPTINKINLYSASDTIDKNFMPIINGDQTIKNRDTITVPDNFCLGIETFDYLNDTDRKFNIYKAELFFDQNLIFQIEFDRLSFDEVGLVNGQVDYYQKVTNKKNVLLLFKFPNNNLSFIKQAVNNGKIFLKDTLIHTIKIIVTDYWKNSDTKTFYVKKDLKNQYNSKNRSKSSKMHILNYNTTNIIEKNQVKFIFPKGCLYTYTIIETNIEHTKKSYNSTSYRIGSSTIPLKKAFEIHMPITLVPKKYQTKALVILIQDRDISPCIGEIENAYIVGKSKKMGLFGLAIDTIPPSIKPLNIKENQKISELKEIKFKVTDDLSDIASYNGYINNQWVLFEFDKKNNLLIYKIDNKRLKLVNEINQLHLIVKDKKNNSAEIKLNFLK